ncbi:ferric reductase like transmembrane component-domain-containing protein [Amylostereum chailletii]|nr:ferric reductase like transmembrane component-domain-containing protein [Amylostereum chailletii]
MESLTSPLVLAAKPSSKDRTLRKARTEEYPKQVWYCIACFLFLLILGNAISWLSLWRRSRRRRAQANSKVQDPEASNRQGNGRVALGRIHVALVNAWRVIAFRSVIYIGDNYTISLTEVFITAAYITALFAWALMNTTNTAGRKFDPSYYANRAGCIAALQTPLVVALGMRNNVIAWLTGISFEKLSYFHRMTARAVCILVWLHAGGWLYIGLGSNHALYRNHMTWGLTSLVALTLLTLVFIRPVRKMNYELFVVIHFILALFMLLGGYFHARDFELGKYIWPSFVLWGFDRVLRVVRLAAFNHGYFGLSSGVGTFNATAEHVSHGFVRLRFRRPDHLHWRPGQSAFLTMPAVSTLPFESHPFTIASADLQSCDGEPASPVSPVDEKRAMDAEGPSPSAQGKELVFLIRAQKGFTKRLDEVAKSSGEMKIFFDGPYSDPPRLAYYDTVVLFAGGSGVSFTSPLFVDLVYRTRKDPTTCRSIIFVWAIREPDQINLVYEDLARALRDAPPNLHISVRIYITDTGSQLSLAGSGSPSSDAASDIDEEKAEARIQRLPRTTVHEGRPEVGSIIQDACAAARGSVACAVRRGW